MREVRLHRAYDIITCNVNEMPNILTFMLLCTIIYIHILCDVSCVCHPRPRGRWWPVVSGLGWPLSAARVRASDLVIQYKV